jgi:hypothetical protein
MVCFIQVLRSKLCRHFSSLLSMQHHLELNIYIIFGLASTNYVHLCDILSSLLSEYCHQHPVLKPRRYIYRPLVLRMLWKITKYCSYMERRERGRAVTQTTHENNRVPLHGDGPTRAARRSQNQTDVMIIPHFNSFM